MAVFGTSLVDTLVEEKFTNVGAFISLLAIAIGHCSAFRIMYARWTGGRSRKDLKKQNLVLSANNPKTFVLAGWHSVDLKIRRSVFHSKNRLSMKFIVPGNLI